MTRHRRQSAAGRRSETGGRGKRPSLGRGLAALFGESGAHLPSEPGGARANGIRSVPIEAIRPSPFQPRRHFAEEELEGLAQSIRGKGIVQPLLVRPAEGDATEREVPSTSWLPASDAGARRSASDCTRSRSSSAASAIRR